jgi:hypothetical protein
VVLLYTLPVEGTVKIWWRLDSNMAVDLDRTLFEKKDTGMVVSEFPKSTLEIFSGIYRMYQGFDFFSGFSGGSIAQLEVGDMIEAGTLNGLPYLGMLMNFKILEKWEKTNSSLFVKVGDDLVIADVWAANFRTVML